VVNQQAGEENPQIFGVSIKGGGKGKPVPVPSSPRPGPEKEGEKKSSVKDPIAHNSGIKKRKKGKGGRAFSHLFRAGREKTGGTAELCVEAYVCVRGGGERGYSLALSRSKHRGTKKSNRYPCTSFAACLKKIAVAKKGQSENRAGPAARRRGRNPAWDEKDADYRADRGRNPGKEEKNQALSDPRGAQRNKKAGRPLDAFPKKGEGDEFGKIQKIIVRKGNQPPSTPTLPARSVRQPPGGKKKKKETLI